MRAPFTEILRNINKQAEADGIVVPLQSFRSMFSSRQKQICLKFLDFQIECPMRVVDLGMEIQIM
jgi:hypothetical protein